MAIQRALLVIADISGYTRFLKTHRINLAHAQLTVAQLLEAVIDAARPRLELQKLEGDAAFFWMPLKSDADAPDVTKIALKLWRGFSARQQELDANRVCTCEGCTGVGDLRVKLVAHLGDVALQKIKKFTELAGVDVILVHRILKNSVPSNEYLLMTEPVAERTSTPVKACSTCVQEDIDGLGPTPLHYVVLQTLAGAVERTKALVIRSGALRRFWTWLRLTVLSMPYLLGMRKACEGFKNFPNALPE